MQVWMDCVDTVRATGDEDVVTPCSDLVRQEMWATCFVFPSALAGIQLCTDSAWTWTHSTEH